MAAIYFILSALLSIFPLVSAWSEVIPGPGMPSLESLNVTSEQLYGMEFKRSLPFGFDKRDTTFTSVCKDQASVGALQQDVMAAYQFLAIQKASQDCAVSGPTGTVQTFVTAGTAVITGTNIGSAPGGTSSRCDYVAFAVGWSFSNCLKNLPSQNNNLVAAGSCAAYGNGSLRVDTVLVNSPGTTTTT